jgi:anti-sigma factor RsiW
MNHKQTQLLLDGYVDGELDLVNALEIEEHLQSCPICSAQFKELKALRGGIERAGLYTAAPAGLKSKIQTSIRKNNPTARSSIFFLSGWRWTVAAFAIVLIIVLGVGLLGGLFNPPSETALVAEVQSAHIRSLMANHLTDVTSTDQHTVKPWFAGKLDFSPPVIELSAQGYPLIGGRLDYLEGHPVAALVYQSDKHYINLFIWPDSGKLSNTISYSDNGYNLIHWNQTGMTFWAVSDLNMDELKIYVELIQKNIT